MSFIRPLASGSFISILILCLGNFLKISSNDGLLPLSIDASEGISAIDYDMKVASAQVKSSILFSALGGNNVSSVNEIIPTRNHSEIMLKNMGASIESEGSKIIVHPLKSKLKSIDISVPSDPSSTAFTILFL